MERICVICADFALFYRTMIFYINFKEKIHNWNSRFFSTKFINGFLSIYVPAFKPSKHKYFIVFIHTKLMELSFKSFTLRQGRFPRSQAESNSTFSYPKWPHRPIIRWCSFFLHKQSCNSEPSRWHARSAPKAALPYFKPLLYLEADVLPLIISQIKPPDIIQESIMGRDGAENPSKDVQFLLEAARHMARSWN